MILHVSSTVVPIYRNARQYATVYGFQQFKVLAGVLGRREAGRVQCVEVLSHDHQIWTGSVYQTVFRTESQICFLSCTAHSYSIRGTLSHVSTSTLFTRTSEAPTRTALWLRISSTRTAIMHLNKPSRNEPTINHNYRPAVTPSARIIYRYVRAT
jgi:hypothetical protein